MVQQQDKKKAASASPTPMQRADDLLRKMTIKEKAMQLSCLYPMVMGPSEARSKLSHISMHPQNQP
jgi:hypothetical protein